MHRILISPNGTNMREAQPLLCVTQVVLPDLATKSVLLTPDWKSGLSKPCVAQSNDRVVVQGRGNGCPRYAFAAGNHQ
jgi:hypothetical protein